MFSNILSANNEWVGLILRVTIGAIMFPHGAQKMLGWFGGYGYTNTMGYFTGTVNLPYIVGAAVILLEFLGSIFLVAGIGTRVIALGMIGLMIGIIFTAHIDNGFFMNWFGTQKGEGYEFHLLIIGLSIALLFEGAGKYSLDGVLVR